MLEVSSWEHGGLCQEGSETCMIALVIISFFSLRGSDQVRLSECFPFRGTWFELKALPASESLLVEAGNPHEKSLATGQRAEFL